MRAIFLIFLVCGWLVAGSEIFVVPSYDESTSKQTFTQNKAGYEESKISKNKSARSGNLNLFQSSSTSRNLGTSRSSSATQSGQNLSISQRSSASQNTQNLAQKQDLQNPPRQSSMQSRAGKSVPPSQTPSIRVSSPVTGEFSSQSKLYQSPKRRSTPVVTQVNELNFSQGATTLTIKETTHYRQPPKVRRKKRR